MSWYLAPFKKYASFSGRARRRELWTFFLVNILLYIGLYAAYGATQTDAFLYAYLAFALLIFLPSIAVAVRRLHDTGKSGAWYFIAFVPLIGGLWLLILLLGAGTEGPNQYGPDPKAITA